MSGVLFSVPGCMRCAVVKKYLRQIRIMYEEQDAIGEGKDAFGAFYRAHRSVVSRGPQGVEFPIWADGTIVRQGLGEVIAHLHSGEALKGFICPGTLGNGWLDGIDLSGGEPTALPQLIEVLRFFKQNGIKLQLSTWGRNAAILEALQAEGLGERVVMTLLGPPAVYHNIFAVDPQEVARAMTAVTRFPEYRFDTNVRLQLPTNNAVGSRDLTIAEVEETARWLKECTRNHRQPYHLFWDLPSKAGQPQGPGTQINLFAYRSTARRHQVGAEIRNV